MVGIDPSLTNYGVSFIGVESGDHTTALYKPEHTGPRRLFELWEFATLVVNTAETTFGVAEYLMEGYSFGSKSQAHKIGEGVGATKLALVMRYGGDEKLAFPTLVSPQALKKYATGKGNGDKNVVLKRVYQKWGADFDSDDMADAFVLARIGVALRSGNTEHAYEAEVVSALERNTEWVPLT